MVLLLLLLSVSALVPSSALLPSSRIGGGRAGRTMSSRQRVTSPRLSELTKRLMSSVPDDVQTGGAGGQSTYAALLKLDESWAKLRKGELPPPRDIVFEEPNSPTETADYDVIVCGGNNGQQTVQDIWILDVEHSPFQW